MNQSPEDRLDAAIDASLGIRPKADVTPTADEAEAKLARFAASLRAKLPTELPSAEGVARGRQKLLAELDAQARPAARSPRGFDLQAVRSAWAATLRSLSTPTGLARRAAVIALVIAALALNGTLAASAGSLPGDPLYGLKRVQEQVRLTITLDEDARAGLQEQIDETRVHELNAIRSMQRVVRTDFSGTVNRIEGDNLIVDTIAFVVQRERFPDVANVVTGDRVTLGVQTNADGSVIVVDFRREPRGKSGVSTVSAPTQTNAPVSATPTAPAVASLTPNTAAATAQPQDTVGTIIPAPTTTAASSAPQTSPTDQDAHQPPAPVSPTGEARERATATQTFGGTPVPTEVRRGPTPPGEPTEAPSKTPDSRPTVQPPSETPGPRPSAPPKETPSPRDTPPPAETPRPRDTPPPAETPRPRDTPPPAETPRPSDTSLPDGTSRPGVTPRPTGD